MIGNRLASVFTPLLSMVMAKPSEAETIAYIEKEKIAKKKVVTKTNKSTSKPK